MNPSFTPGSKLPLGSSLTEKGINFSVYSHHATNIKLRLFEIGQKAPFAEFPMERSADYWHLCVANLPSTFEYTYQVEGPYDPSKGFLFCKEMDLVDPYARAVNASDTWGNHHTPMRALYETKTPFDWEHTSRPMIPAEDLIIYEMHVRSFTMHPSSGSKNPGTFLGMIEKIPYLKKLGINAVELMPIHEFNETENLHRSPGTGGKLFNYWGYSTSNFFAPMRRFGKEKDLKFLIRELHREGIEVILDVVYNHTSEGNDQNYYHSFRGLDNPTYYIIDENGYHNYTGCGNTLKCQHPVVQDLILDSLRYWVTEFHVDGFRFDLASIMTRGENGKPIQDPPLIKRIASDPILAPTKMIAEPWDPAGLYQVGTFPSWRFAEWNGKFRDDVRKFIRGDGNIEAMKNRLLGSPDVYTEKGTPQHSINFITVHDGFTLHDLVSYNEKHNEQNGEQNQDGANDNESWNCGVEGKTTDQAILNLRLQQMRNFMVALFIAQGIPMLLMGDEYAHTREGNNNAYCQDNELNYFLWDQASPLFEFIQKLIALRKSHPIFRQKTFPSAVKWEEKDYLGLTLGEELFIAFNPTAQEYQLEKEGWEILLSTASQVQTLDKLQPYTSVLFGKKKAL
ncbi:MAG: glycogen-debranching protein [Chlamydiales bacterium]|nr:glycogen-debranching protein [Chlamydiales bacterium]